MAVIQLGKLLRVLDTLSKIGVADQSIIGHTVDTARMEGTLSIGLTRQPDLETHEFLTANGFVLVGGLYLYRPR